MIITRITELFSQFLIQLTEERLRKLLSLCVLRNFTHKISSSKVPEAHKSKL